MKALFVSWTFVSKGKTYHVRYDIGYKLWNIINKNRIVEVIMDNEPPTEERASLVLDGYLNPKPINYKVCPGCPSPIGCRTKKSCFSKIQTP